MFFMPTTKKTVAKKAVSKTAAAKKAATKKTTTRTTSKKTAAKKTAPKKTVAKKAARKKVTRATAAKQLVCAPDAACFWVTDGSVLRDLTELALAFGSMDDTVFIYHVSGERNDFADWVEHVLEDAACAADLRATATPKKAATVVRRHLKLYLV